MSIKIPQITVLVPNWPIECSTLAIIQLLRCSVLTGVTLRMFMPSCLTNTLLLYLLSTSSLYSISPWFNALSLGPYYICHWTDLLKFPLFQGTLHLNSAVLISSAHLCLSLDMSHFAPLIYDIRQLLGNFDLLLPHMPRLDKFNLLLSVTLTWHFQQSAKFPLSTHSSHKHFSFMHFVSLC